MSDKHVSDVEPGKEDEVPSPRTRVCTVAFLSYLRDFIGSKILFCLCSAVPNLRRYLNEEQHHLPSSCTLTSTNHTGPVQCTYEHNCGDVGCQYRGGEFSCIRVTVDYLAVNGSRKHAELFRSFPDAQKTKFQCAAYECQNAHKVLEFKNSLESDRTFQCFYHPEKPDVAYMDKTDEDEFAVIVFTLLCGCLLITIPVLILLIGFIYYNCSHKACWT